MDRSLHGSFSVGFCFSSFHKQIPPSKHCNWEWMRKTQRGSCWKKCVLQKHRENSTRNVSDKKIVKYDQQ